MYKSVRFKRYVLAFEKFKINAKKISKVYRTGFWIWQDDINNIKFYSLVFYIFRVTFIIELKGKCGCKNNEF